MHTMKLRDAHLVRRVNLRSLIREHGGPTALARELGHSNGSYLAQLAGPHPTRTVSEKAARGIEEALRLPVGWLDRDPRDVRVNVK